MLVRPTPGMVYYFKFKDGMNKLAGIYKVSQIMTYSEYLANGGDILKDFFEPNGKDEAVVNSVLDELRICEIYRLTSPEEADTDVVVYAPSLYVESSPDYNVKAYQRLGMVSMIGVTDDPDQLKFMKDNFIEMIEASLGITPDPKFVSLGRVWMTDTQYKEELSKRNEEKKKVISYFADTKKLSQQLAEANTKIAEYEKLIIQLTKTQGGS